MTVFARDGFQAARVEDICAEAGLTTGALYAHFGSKEALLRTVYSEHITATLRTMEGALAAGAEGGILAVAEAAMQDAATEIRNGRLGIEVILRAYRDEALRAEYAPLRRAARDRLASVLAAEAERRGLELPMPAEHLASVIRAMINGMALERLVDPDGAPVEAFAAFPRVLLELMEAAQRPSPRPPAP